MAKNLHELSSEQYFVRKFNKNPLGVIREINDRVEKGYIRKQQNSLYKNLYIFNYTQKAQFDEAWDMYTMACRGLVLDVAKMEIVALPFSKFFNYGEVHEQSWKKEVSNVDMRRSFDLYEKVDGSLGIGFFYKGNWIWCTRGSFNSEQANFANNFTRNKYSQEELEKFEFEYSGMTMLAEIVYPENRIVVNYGGKKDLILLTMFRNKDGKEIPYEDLVIEADNLELSVVEGGAPYGSLKDAVMDSDNWDVNFEGYVARFSNGARLKIKGDKYLQAHRAMYSMSLKSMVKYWADGDFDYILDNYPDEFIDDVYDLKHHLESLVETFSNQANKWVKELVIHNIPRKDVYTFLKQEGLDGWIINLVFKTLDKRPYEDRLQTIKDNIYKNYDQYVRGEVASKWRS